MNLELRDYQNECIEAVLNEFASRVTRQLCVLPTGAGKTILMAAIAKRLNRKTLLLAHREELISQAVDKFKLFWPEVDIGVCMADRDEIDHQIVIGSVQSCSRDKRLARLVEKGFDLLMIDEAHHSVSDSYKKVIETLGFSEESEKLLIGVTATPERADGAGLGTVFDKIVFSRSIGTMIRAGYLSPVTGRRILTNFNFERIAVRNGDFAIEDLSEAVNTQERNDFIVEKFKTYSPGRKGVAFCVDVQHCKDLSDAFIRAGINSTAVYGEMSSTDRRNALESLKSGEIQIATSCGVLCEGFDEPSVDAVIMARPTKSRGLYVQCVGRGLRLWPGKSDCLVFDFTDRGHNLDSVMTLSRSVPESMNFDEKGDICQDVEREEIDRTSKIKTIESCDEAFDILGAARFIWVRVDDQWSLQDDDRNEIVMIPSDGGFVASIYMADGKEKKIVSTPLPVEYCSGVCEDYARRHLKISFADASKPWMLPNAHPTQGQIDFLEKNSAWKDGMKRGDCNIAIRTIIAKKNKQRRIMASEPITPKQKFFLTSHGVVSNNMTKLQALSEIAKIKQSSNLMGCRR